MQSQRVNKPLGVVLLVVAVSLALPPFASAYTGHNLPLRTATTAVAGWPYDGHPDTPYQLWIDPPILRVGYDEQSGLIYESLVVADVGSLHTAVGADLHLSTVAATQGAILAVTPLSLQHPVPEPIDFAWLARALAGGDDMIIRDPYAFGLGTYEVWEGGGRYHTWCLGFYTGYGEFAGVGGPNAPYVTVFAVPEPPTAAVLLAGVLAMLVLGLARLDRGRHDLQPR